MKSSKKIEINRSTLVSLKAELCRKQEEVSEAKIHSQFVRPTPSAPKKPNIWDKKNPGVDGREERDFEEIEAENNALKRSRSILEAKAELYDKLSSAGASKVETLLAQSVALVDFRQKQREDAQRSAQEVEEEEEEDQYDSDQYDKPDNSDDEWVDYQDCLGRTRRCLRKDLPHLKTQDSRLAGTLGYIDTTPAEVPPEPEAPPRAPTPPLEQRLVSGDMQREALRAKWEQEQTELLKKDDVHYQDILYDEVRSHGVSYYGFSRDEKQRRVQQETLARVRAETRKRQAEAQNARTRREQQLRARLRAAANRKRERQGLPPLPDSDDERAPGDSDEEAELERILLGSRAAQREPEPEPEPLTREERPAPAEPRAWDLEKERPVMSQHEWNEKQRAERKTEFAPPSTSLYGFHSGGKFQLEARRKPSPEPVRKPEKDQPLTVSRRTKRRVSSSSSDEETIGPLPPPKAAISVPPPDFSVPPPGYAAPSPSFIPLPSTSAQKAKRTWSDVPTPDPQKAKKTWSDTPAAEAKNPKRSWSDTPAAEVKKTWSDTPATEVKKTWSDTPAAEAKNPKRAWSDAPATEVKKTGSDTPATEVKKTWSDTPAAEAKNPKRSWSDAPATEVKKTWSDTPAAEVKKTWADTPATEAKNPKRAWSDETATSSRGRGVEIAPPPTMEYNIGAPRSSQASRPGIANQKQVESSIAAGLAYLRKQSEDREKQRPKGRFDVI